MDKKTAIIGALLGVSIIGVLIWLLFFRKGADGSTFAQKATGKKPVDSGAQSKDVKPVGSFSNAQTNFNANPFPMKKGSSGQYVGMLQDALAKAGLYKMSIDNAWGNGTESAFQKAFPNAIGISDLKDLEAKIAQLKGGAVNTSASSSMAVVKYDSRFKDKLYRFKVQFTPKEFPGSNAPNASDPYNVGEIVGLTGRWANVAGENWSEFERYGNRGKAWVKDSAIQPK